MCACVGFSGAVVSCLFVLLTIFSEIFDRRMLWLNGFSFFFFFFFFYLYVYVRTWEILVPLKRTLRSAGMFKILCIVEDWIYLG